MNYFTIGGRKYRAEIRQGTPGDASFYAMIDPVGSGRRGPILHRTSRPGARRALNREIERLATGPDGKRANWSVVYPQREIVAGLLGIAASAATTAAAVGAMRDATDRAGYGARRIVERAAERAGLSVPEFVRRVRGEVRA